MMSTQFTTKTLTRELVDAWNARDWERLAPLYTADYEGLEVGDAAPQHGLAGLQQSAQRYWDAFPDLRILELECIVQDERVALAWVARGTHRGRLMNIPATGRTVMVQGISWLVMEDGRVKRSTTIWDVAGLLRAIGLLPEL
jgi:steroid delta-isomerase-like uncharacterized protein